MLKSRQAQTEASWQNKPDYQYVHWKLNITLQSVYSLRSDPATAHVVPPSISVTLSAAPIKEANNSSEGLDT